MNNDINQTIEKIFSENNLETPFEISKFDIGFTNLVFSINDKYILKICNDIDNEKNFEKEVYFYNFFKNKIPVPELIFYDNSKSIYDKHYMIYHKIPGVTLYTKWHLITKSQRKSFIKQLCSILKKINHSSFEDFEKTFNQPSNFIWHDRIISKINKSLKKVQTKKILSQDFINKIKGFAKDNQNVLKEQKIALVYWDSHFDNILIQDNKIVGILDFERTELASIDFTLDLIRRMIDYPKKYMSPEYEKFARKDDYRELLVWFKTFYPELFNFKNLDKRLDLYSIKHDLDTLLGWPNSDEVKEMIAKVVGYKL